MSENGRMNSAALDAAPAVRSAPEQVRPRRDNRSRIKSRARCSRLLIVPTGSDRTFAARSWLKPSRWQRITTERYRSGSRSTSSCKMAEIPSEWRSPGISEGLSSAARASRAHDDGASILESARRCAWPPGEARDRESLESRGRALSGPAPGRWPGRRRGHRADCEACRGTLAGPSDRGAQPVPRRRAPIAPRPGS